MLIGITGEHSKVVTHIWQLLDIFYNKEPRKGSHRKFVKNKIKKDKYLGAYVMRSDFKDKYILTKAIQVASLMTGVDQYDFINRPDLCCQTFVGNRMKNYMKASDLLYEFYNMMREQIGSNVWINALFADYKAIQQWPEYGLTAAGGRIPVGMNCIYPYWIVGDLGHQDEFFFIKDKHGIVINTNSLADTIYARDYNFDFQFDPLPDVLKLESGEIVDDSLDSLIQQTYDIMVRCEVIKPVENPNVTNSQ